MHLLKAVFLVLVTQFFKSPGIDDDDAPTEETTTASVPDEIPPLEGEGEDDASRMEEVD